MVLEVPDYCFGASVEEGHLNCSPGELEVNEKEESWALECTWGHAPGCHAAPPLKDFHYLLIAPQAEDQAFAT